MDEATLVETVRREGQLESDDAARSLVTATLETLGERVTDGAAEDLAARLPDAVADPLVDPTPGEADPFSLEEFTARVSERAGVDEADVVPGARAVAVALSEAASGELEAVREQLPPAFDVLFEPGGPTTSAQFLDLVAERAPLDSESAARNATSATLRTLGERLTRGEASDLAHYLPDDLAEDLLHAAGEDGTDLSLDEFHQRVAQREGVEKPEAALHARAVGSTLAEAASVREVDAARKQVPDPFGVVFEPPGQ